MKLKLIIILAYCVLLSACSSGASIYSNYRDLENLELIETLGIDNADGGVALTVSADNNVVSQTGRSIVTAINALQSFSTDDDMYYAHTKYVVVGADSARTGILPYLDYFERSTQFRFDLGMFLVRNGTAVELMSTTLGENGDITDIIASIERMTQNSGDTQVFSAKDIARASLENGAALICAVDIMPTEDIIYSIAPENIAVSAGFGILREGVLVGYLDSSQSRATRLLLGESSLGTVRIGDFGLTVDASSLAITPVWKSDGLRKISITCDIGVGIAEINSDTTELSDEQYSAIENALENLLENDILDVLMAQMVYDADFLGLSQILNRDNVSGFEQISDNFPLSLSSVSFEIELSATVDRSYSVRP